MPRGDFPGHEDWDGAHPSSQATAPPWLRHKHVRKMNDHFAVRPNRGVIADRCDAVPFSCHHDLVLRGWRQPEPAREDILRFHLVRGAELGPERVIRCAKIW